VLCALGAPQEQAQAFCAYYLQLPMVRNGAHARHIPHGSWPSRLGPRRRPGWFGPPQDDRRKLLRLLSVHFGVRSDKARQAARAYLAAGDAGSNGDRREQRLLQELAAAVRPVHAVLFSAISQLPEGMEFILQVRTDLHQLHAAGPADPALQQLDDALKAQLQAWFALGFLQLRRISWETPAVVLEKVRQGAEARGRTPPPHRGG